MFRLPLLAAAFCAAASLAQAESAPGAHAGHSMTGMGAASTLGFMEANAAMHDNMAIEFSGNADVDFVRGMIPHHQGAVAMAKIVLEHGKDPEVRKLAEGVIAAQEAEITWMQDWLAKNAP